MDKYIPIINRAKQCISQGYNHPILRSWAENTRPFARIAIRDTPIRKLSPWIFKNCSFESFKCWNYKNPKENIHKITSLAKKTKKGDTLGTSQNRPSWFGKDPDPTKRKPYLNARSKSNNFENTELILSMALGEKHETVLRNGEDEQQRKQC